MLRVRTLCTKKFSMVGRLQYSVVNTVALKSFHSAIPSFARARNDKPSTLDLLTVAYQETVEVENTEVVTLPENVSEEFFLDYEKLSKSLSGDKEIASSLKTNDGFNLLLQLLKSARNTEELELVRNLSEMWIRSGRIFTKEKSVKLLELCLLFGREQLAFDMLCNRATYRLRPEPTHISSLLKYYANQSISSNDPSMLDMAYKCFVLSLYYDIPPTVEAYSLLIACGNYMVDPIGVERSLVTWNEMRSLGWTTNSEGSFSMVHRSLKDGDAEKALAQMSEIRNQKLDSQEQKQLLLFEAEAQLKLGNKAAASESFQKVLKTADVDTASTASTNLFGADFWVTEAKLATELNQ